MKKIEIMYYQVFLKIHYSFIDNFSSFIPMIHKILCQQHDLSIQGARCPNAYPNNCISLIS